MIELETTQGATRQEYREAPDDFQNLFYALNGYDAAIKGEFVVSVYHLENIAMEDDTISSPLRSYVPN